MLVHRALCKKLHVSAVAASSWLSERIVAVEDGDYCLIRDAKLPFGNCNGAATDYKGTSEWRHDFPRKMACPGPGVHFKLFEAGLSEDVA